MAKNVPISDNSGFRYQSTMPNNKNSYRADQAMFSTELQLATVVSVDYAKMTAQVTTQSTTVTQGEQARYGALMPLEFFSSNLLGEVYGTYRPIEVGSTVLIGFLNSNVNTPIIIGVYAAAPEAILNIAPTNLSVASDREYPIRDEVLTRKTVFPSQQIEVNSEKGDYIRTFNGRSLFMVDADDFGKLDDISFDGTFDMRLRKSDTNRTLYNVPVQAQRMLLLHQSNTNADTHRTRFYIDKNGNTNFLWFDSQSNQKLVGFSGNKDDGVGMFFLHDSLDQDASKVYSQINLTYNNRIVLRTQDQGQKGSIEITPNGTTIDGVKVASESNFMNLSNKFSQLQDKLSSIDKEIESVAPGYIASLPDKLAGLTRDIATNSRNIDAVQKNVNTAASAASAANTKIDQLQADTQNQLKALSDQISGINSVINDYGQLSSSVYDLRGRMDTVEREIRDYQSSAGSYLTANSPIITQLTQTQSTQSSQLSSIQSGLSSVQGDIGTIKTDLKNIHSTISSGGSSDHDALVQLQQQYAALADEVATLKTQINKS